MSNLSVISYTPFSYPISWGCSSLMQSVARLVKLRKTNGLYLDLLSMCVSDIFLDHFSIQLSNLCSLMLVAIWKLVILRCSINGNVYSIKQYKISHNWVSIFFQFSMCLMLVISSVCCIYNLFPLFIEEFLFPKSNAWVVRNSSWDITDNLQKRPSTSYFLKRFRVRGTHQSEWVWENDRRDALKICWHS